MSDQTALLPEENRSSQLALVPEVDDAAHMSSTQSRALPTEFGNENIAKGVRRGTISREILSAFGHHWASNVDENWTWDRSEPVSRLQCFLSHSWRASRWLKTLVLLCYYNFAIAYTCSISAAIFAGVLVYNEVLPSTGRLQMPLFGKITAFSLSYWPYLCGIITFAFFFCFWQRVRFAFESMNLLSPQYAFLDKLAINQLDMALKQQGIDSLGAFINASDKFCILWSPEYFTRLWCTFEVATVRYLTLHCGANTEIVFLPLSAFYFYALLFLSFLSMSIGVCMANSLNNINVAQYAEVLFLICFICFIIAVHGIRQYHHQVLAMEKQFANFALRDTECFAESDRAKVEASITEWLDPRTLDTNKAISKFDTFVQNDLLVLMRRFTNVREMLSYRTCLTVYLPQFFANSLMEMGDNQNGANYLSFVLLNGVIPDFSSMPIAIALACASVRLLEDRCMPTDVPAGAVKNICVLLLETLVFLAIIFLAMCSQTVTTLCSETIAWFWNVAVILLTYFFFNMESITASVAEAVGASPSSHLS